MDSRQNSHSSCFKFSLVLTEYSLHGHPEEALDVAPLVDNGDPVDQRDGVGQVRQIHNRPAYSPEPGKPEETLKYYFLGMHIRYNLS